MPGPAAADAPRRKPAAPQRAVAQERLLGVMRAGGVEAAGWRKHRRHEPSVGEYEDAEKTCHHRWLSREKRRTSCRYISGLGLTPYGGRTRTSTLPSRWHSSLNASRIRRLIALRSEASLAWRRETIMPSRASPRSRGAK